MVSCVTGTKLLLKLLVYHSSLAVSNAYAQRGIFPKDNVAKEPSLAYSIKSFRVANCLVFNLGLVLKDPDKGLVTFATKGLEL